MNEIEDKKTFAQFFKEKRIALGMTFRELAIHIYGDEKKFSYLSKIERGERNPTYENAKFILEKLNCNLNIEEL